MLHLLDIQATQLSEMEDSIDNISQVSYFGVKIEQSFKVDPLKVQGFKNMKTLLILRVKTSLTLVCVLEFSFGSTL